MIKVTTLCFLLVFCQCLALASSQQMNTEEVALKLEKLTSKIERAVREKSDGWLLKRKSLLKSSATNSWSGDKGFLDIKVYYKPSTSEAERILHLAPETISAPHKRDKIAGIGDEAYLLTFEKGRSTILFRKSNVVVYVETSTLADAQTFAKLVDSSIVP
jgi:hypothetical protein